MRYVIGICIALAFILVAWLVSTVMFMEEEAMEDPEELKGICDACMWREVGDTSACERCFIREALEDYDDDDDDPQLINID